MGYSDPDDLWYKYGSLITGVLVFLGCWVYSIITWGFLLGVGLGWIPSFFIAIMAAWLWPIFAALIVLPFLIYGGVIVFKWYKTLKFVRTDYDWIPGAIIGVLLMGFAVYKAFYPLGYDKKRQIWTGKKIEKNLDIEN